MAEYSKDILKRHESDNIISLPEEGGQWEARVCNISWIAFAVRACK
jgi:hypothetical protein